MSLIHFFAPNVEAGSPLRLEDRALLSVLGVPLLVMYDRGLPPWKLLSTYESFPFSLLINTRHIGFRALASQLTVKLFLQLIPWYSPERYLANSRAAGDVEELDLIIDILEPMFYREN